LRARRFRGLRGINDEGAHMSPERTMNLVIMALVAVILVLFILIILGEISSPF
jgi:hypothetical protein